MKPRMCPFCTAQKAVRVRELGGTSFVDCGECYAEGPLVDSYIKDPEERRRQAITLWNRALRSRDQERDRAKGTHSATCALSLPVGAVTCAHGFDIYDCPSCSPCICPEDANGSTASEEPGHE